MTSTLCLIFFFSGASALIFELLWFQLSGLTFGNSIWATSIVLSSFMAGLALGNGITAFWGHKIKAPIRLYAFLEISIAVSGFLLVFVFPDLTRLLVPLFSVFSDQYFIINSLRGFIAFILMLIPATAMGATLPLLVKALHAEKPNFGSVLGILYGWNTMGAVAGVMIGELYFVKWFGLKGAGIVAACFNIFAAIMAIYVSKKYTKADKFPISSIDSLFFSFKSSFLLLASFLSGFTLLALEVIWFRFILLFFNAVTWNFSVMLAMVLAGISLGGIFASKQLEMESKSHDLLVPSLFANGILVIVLYGGAIITQSVLANINPFLRITFFSLYLIFPVSFLSGVIFTMIGKSLYGEMKVETKATGFLTLANTIGALLGSLVSAFIFIPNLGIEKSFFLLAVIYGVIALLVLDIKQFAKFKKNFSRQQIAAVLFVLSLFIFPFGLMEKFLSIPCSHYENIGENKVAFREGLTETVQYLRNDLLGVPYYYRMLTNNHSMSSTILEAKRYMKLFTYIPVAIHPDPKRALLICFGVGSTAKSLIDTKNLESIDIVDTSKDILEMSKVIFTDSHENPVNDSRVTIHIEDGRYFLLTTERKFDLITGEPPPPKMSGIVNLYTQEYFQLIYDRLSEGGIVSYWLPVYQLKVSETKSILKSFSNVFKDCTLWTGANLEWVIVGTKNLQGPVTEKHFSRQWNDPVVGPEMRALGFHSPEELGSFFIADPLKINSWVSESLPLVDNYPRRLSSDFVGKGWEKKQIAAYNAFMQHSDSLKNFIQSKQISNILPASIRNKSLKHFPVRQTINYILSSATFSTVKDPKHLPSINSCIRNPLLSNYIMWSFGSDEHAQKIISQFLKSESRKQSGLSPAIYDHLAAGAAQKRNFLLAEEYLHLAEDSMEQKDNLNSALCYTTVRMYLLYISGKKDHALKIGEEYVHLDKSDDKARRKQIDQNWNWILKNAPSNINGNK